MCPGIPDLQPDPGDPKVPEGAHLSSCSLGSLSSNLSISKDPVPPALWGTQKNRPPRFSPQGSNPLTTGTQDSGIPGPSSLRNVGSSALAPVQDLEKRSSTFSPLVDTRTRSPSPSPVGDPGTRADSYLCVGKHKSVPSPPLLPSREPSSSGPAPIPPIRAQNMRRSPLPSK